MYANDRLLEIFQRSRKGQYMKEVEYDLLLARRVQELVKEYNITFDPNIVCPADDGMADRVFQAGLQLFIDVGAYHLDTERVLKFNRGEILDALRKAPDTLYLGEGRDMVIARHRNIEDPNPPLNLTGPAGQPCSEEHYLELMISYAQEPYVHAIESGATLTYNGMDIAANTLLEIKAVQRDAATAREAIRRVGKPGMHIGDAATGMTAVGKMAASEPVNLLRPCDGRLVAQMCEMKKPLGGLNPHPGGEPSGEGDRMFPKARIPYGTWGSSYFPAWQTSPLAEVNIGQFAGEAMGRILAKRQVPKDRLDYLIIGSTIPWHWKFWNAPLVASCLGHRIPGFHVEQACATGLQATLLAAAEVESGAHDVVGVLTFDRTSDSPVGVFPERRAHQRTHALSDVWDNFGFDPATGNAMIATAGLAARKYKIERREVDDMTFHRYEQYFEAKRNTIYTHKHCIMPPEG